MRRVIRAGIAACITLTLAEANPSPALAQTPPANGVTLSLAEIDPQPAPAQTPAQTPAPAQTSPVSYPAGSSFLSSPLSCGPLCGPVCGPPGRFWVSADYLLWRVKGDALPPLVTVAPAGTSPVANGVTLFGDEHVNNDWRSGGRVTAGFWLDHQQTLGLEASFFALGDATTDFSAASGGNPILARPFFNAAIGQPDAELVALPGVLSGQVAATESSTFLGAGAWLRHNLCCNACFRLDGLLGYRYLRLTDQLGITENLTSINPNSTVAPLGTQLLVTDRFSSTNDFHGVDLGLSGELRRARWVLQATGRVALGGNITDLDVSGATTVTVPGFAPVTNPGGLLALSSNSGQFTRHHFAVVPTVGVKLGYQVTPRLRAFAGYDLLYWTQVVRPGGQIDPVVNANLLPPVTPPVAGPARPEPRATATDVWAQGIGLGLEFRY